MKKGAAAATPFLSSAFTGLVFQEGRYMVGIAPAIVAAFIATFGAFTTRATVATAFATAAVTTGTTIAALALFAGRTCVFQFFASFLVDDAHRQTNLAARI